MPDAASSFDAGSQPSVDEANLQYKRRIPNEANPQYKYSYSNYKRRNEAKPKYNN